MSDILAERVEKPIYFKIAPLLRGRGKRKTQVIGFDSEASKGRPFLMQFSRIGGEDQVECYTVPDEERGGLWTILDYFDTNCTRKDTEYILFGWNLAYEWTQLFDNLPPDNYGLSISCLPEFVFDVRHLDGSGNLRSVWRISATNDKRYFATFTHLGTKRRIRLIDGMAYYVTGLNAAGKMLGLGAKLAICGLEHEYDKKCAACAKRIRNLTRADLDDPVFMRYSRQDAYITRRIGEQIMDMHSEYDVATCVSAPMFAARVFRHHFLNAEIAQPSPDLEQIGLDSYHGGKNGYYLAGPRHLRGMYSYDITSAYPEAMRAIPNPETATWEPVTDWQPGRHALYRVTMQYKPCRYHGALYHDGKKIYAAGYYDGLAITSYELDAIMAHGEAKLITCTGWEMVGESGAGPLAAYVDTFFELKRKSEGPQRESAKLFLNSLYGKFFQKVALGDVGYYEIDERDPDAPAVRIEHDPANPFDWRAGGLYHPPIASLITGFVRGKIHRLEHKYNAVMTSTDGFFARRKPDPADIGKDLGKLTVARGDVSIWRERLYIFDPGQDGKRKAALHGYRGSVDDLAKVPLAPGAYEYTASQLVTLRLAGRTFRGADGSRVEPLAGEIAPLLFEIRIAGPPN